MLSITDIKNIPINILQQNGFIFMWIINHTYYDAILILEKWGYEFVNTKK